MIEGSDQPSQNENQWNSVCVRTSIVSTFGGGGGGGGLYIYHIAGSCNSSSDQSKTTLCLCPLNSKIILNSFNNSFDAGVFFAFVLYLIKVKLLTLK